MSLFDGSADAVRNRELAKAVDAEGRRRLKSGLSGAGRVRLHSVEVKLIALPENKAVA